MALVPKTFSEIITFTRASSGTYVAADGTITSAATDVPRFGYDPITLAPLGLLIEPVSTNYTRKNITFATHILVLSGVSTAFVDGETVTATGGGTGTYYEYGSLGTQYAIYQGTGTFSGTLTGATSGATATITSSTVFWTRFPGTSAIIPRSAAAPDGLIPGSNWTGTKWQEDTTTSSRPIAQSITLGANATVTGSIFVKQTGGAIRHFRIQITDAGGVNGFRAIFDLSTNTVASQTTVIGAGTAVANSASITAYPNGWYRLSASGGIGSSTNITTFGFMQDTTAGVATYTGDGTSGLYIWGVQIENVSSATSLIYTDATSVTRATDTATVNTLSPWYNSIEGTLYAEYNIATARDTQNAATLSDGDMNNRMVIRASNTSGQTAFLGVVAAVTQWGMTFSSAPTNVTVKSAFAYKQNDILSTRNAGTVLNDTAATIPPVTQLNLGTDGNVLQSLLRGYLQRVIYYPRHLSSTELQTLTT